MRVLAILACLFVVTCPASAKSLDAEAINNAQFGAPFASKNAISPLLIKAEILLARAHFSPGEISGRDGRKSQQSNRCFRRSAGESD
jgi:hypothetical protein